MLSSASTVDQRWLADEFAKARPGWQRHGYRLLAFVFMPEHVHLIVYPMPELRESPRLLQAIKRPCSYRIKQHLIATKPDC